MNERYQYDPCDQYLNLQSEDEIRQPIRYFEIDLSRQEDYLNNFAEQIPLSTRTLPQRSNSIDQQMAPNISQNSPQVQNDINFQTPILRSPESFDKSQQYQNNNQQNNKNVPSVEQTKSILPQNQKLKKLSNAKYTLILRCFQIFTTQKKAKFLERIWQKLTNEGGQYNIQNFIDLCRKYIKKNGNKQYFPIQKLIKIIQVKSFDAKFCRTSFIKYLKRFQNFQKFKDKAKQKIIKMFKGQISTTQYYQTYILQAQKLLKTIKDIDIQCSIYKPQKEQEESLSLELESEVLQDINQHKMLITPSSRSQNCNVSIIHNTI